MNRKKVRTLLKLFEIMKNHYTKEAFIVAVYIYLKYGYKIFQKKIDYKKLKLIYKEIKNQKSLFNNELNSNIDKIIELDRRKDL